jgi:hypothetical protein
MGNPEPQSEHTFLHFTRIDEDGHACLEGEHGDSFCVPRTWLPNNAQPGAIFFTSQVANDDISSLFFDIDLHPAWSKRKG